MNRKSLLLLCVLLPGCMGPIWHQYGAPNYSPARADRVCHPYGFCSQGKWVPTELAQDDSTSASIACQEKIRQPSDGWSDSSVSIGLEMGRCMRLKGHELVSH